MIKRSRTAAMKTLSMVILFVLIASMFIPVAKASGADAAIQSGDAKASDIPTIPIPVHNRSQPAPNVAPPKLTFYSPIEIGSDADLVTFAVAHSYPGNGSSENPFVFDGIYISFNYYTYGTALAIHDTTLHFIISNSTFYNAKFSSTPYQIGAGIMLSNVQNAEIENCQMSNNIEDIKIVSSYNLTIRSTDFSPYNYGGICLDMQTCHDVIIEGCNLQAGYYNPVGVNIISCSNCTFDDNDFSGRSTYLMSSDGNLFKNNTWSNMYDYGLDLRTSDGNLVQGNTFYSAYWANINSIECQNNSIFCNQFYGYTDKCVYLESSIDTQICGNDFIHSSTSIYAVGGGGDLICNNTIRSSSMGIRIISDHDEMVLKNNISDCYDSAIDLSGGSNVKIYSNKLVNDSIYTYTDPTSLSQYDIPSNNTVNGGPVYYYVATDATGMEVPLDAGQVIVATTNYLHIHNLFLTKQNYGILALYSSDLLIENNTISDMNQIGMSIKSGSTEVIQNNSLVNFTYGIALYDAGSSQILDNNLKGGDQIGILVSWCGNVKVQENVIDRCEHDGIQLSQSGNNWLYSNHLTGASIDLYGSNVEAYSTEDIPVNNTVNGRPVYYYNIDDVTIPTDAGEVILGGVSDVSVLGLNLSDQNTGLVVGFSDGIMIGGCQFHNNTDFGVRFFQSSEATVQGNDLGLISTGLYVQQSTDMRVEKNNITGMDQGIEIYDSMSIDACENNLTECYVAIFCQSSSLLDLSGNNISGGSTGIELRYSVTQSTVSNNSVSGVGCAFDYYSVGSIVSENNTVASCYFGFSIYSCTGLSLQYNQINDSHYGFQLQSCSSIQMRGNDFVRDSCGMVLSYCPNLVIANNTMLACGVGIELDYGSDGCVVQRNEFDQCGAAVNLNCPGLSMLNNTVRDTYTAFGVSYNQDNQVLSGNHIINCTNGVVLAQFCDNCVIRDNHMEQISGIGVDIEWSDNALVTGNEISGSGVGIYAFSGSSNYQIYGFIGQNNISTGGYGIHISSYATFVVYGNMLNSCLGDGIMISSSLYNQIYGNHLTFCSIDIEGSENAFIYQDIPTNNTVNAKPVYYYSASYGPGVSGVEAPTDAGELIYANVGNFIVKDLSLTNQTVALITAYCTQFTVQGCTFGDVTINAVKSWHSTQMHAFSNLFVNDKIGMYMDGGSTSSQISVNQFRACVEGLLIYGGIDQIYGNNFTGCADGMMSNNGHSDVHDNLFVNSTDSGYWAYGGSDTVQYNVFRGSPNGASLQNSEAYIDSNVFSLCGNGIYGQFSNFKASSNSINNSTIGIEVLSDSGSWIEGNDIRECHDGIMSSPYVYDDGEISTGYGTSLDDNVIRTCDLGVGMTSIDGCQVNSNFIYDCPTGIKVNNTQQGYFQNNLVNGSYDGILIETSKSLTIDSNTISASGHIGISLMSSSKIEVTYNLISDSVSYGMLTNLSYGCTINLNRFIDNNGAGDNYSTDHIQAYDDGYIYVEHDPPVYDYVDPYDGYITTSDEVDIEWYVHDEGSGTASSVIRIDGGEWMQPDDWENEGEGYDSWGFYSAFYPMTEGKYLFEICTTDNCGNQAFRFINITVDFDYNGPMFEDWWPSDGQSVNVYEGYAYCYGYIGDYSITSCYLTVDGNPLEVSWGLEGNEWYMETDNFVEYGISAGHHQFNCTVTDSGGNVATLLLNLILSGEEENSPAPTHSNGGGNSGSVSWNTDLGNYWSDWLTPDANRDSIVDQPYQIAGSNATDAMPLAYLAAIPYINYVDFGDDHVEIDWTANYTLVDSGVFEIFRNSTDGNQVFTTGDTYFYDEDVAEWGNYTYSVRVNDQGFIGIASNSVTVRIPDDIDPEVYIDTPNDGDYVGQAYVSWEGYDYESGIDHYEVSLNGVDWINVGNATEYTFANATLGWDTAYVRAYDVAGNHCEESVEFYLDNIGPTVDIQYPSNNDTYDVDSEGWVQFEWNAYDDDSGVASVWMVINGQEPIDVTEMDGSWLLQLEDGHYNVTFYAIDETGNEGPHSSVNFTVDTVAPELTIMSPEDESYTTNCTVNLIWQGQDSGSGIDGYEVYLDDDFVAWTTGTSMEFANLSEGWHLFEVYAYDNVGNVAYSSAWTCVVTQGPSVDIISPSSGDHFNASSEGWVDFEWNAYEEATGIDSVYMVINGQEPIDVTDMDGSWLLQLEDGQYNVTFYAIDDLGLNGSASVHFTIDTVAPELTITTPENEGVMTAGSPTIEWNASDEGSGIYRFSLNMDDVFLGWTTNLSMDVSGLNGGWHLFEIYAIDNAGNEQYASVEFLIDTQGPTVDIVTPSNGDLFNHDSSGGWVDITWDAQDAGAGVSSVWMVINGSEPVDVTDLYGEWYIHLDDGQYNVTLYAIDEFGIAGPQSSVEFTVDTVAPELKITTPLDGTYVTNDSPTVHWNSSDAISGINGFDIYLDGEYVASTSDLSIQLEGLNDGEHLVEIYAYDYAGNEQYAAVDFNVDTHAPVLQILTPEDGAIFNGTSEGSVTVQWNVIDNQSGLDHVEVRLDEGSWATVSDTSEFVFEQVADGSHTVSVRAYDCAGLVTEKDFGFLMDSVAPEITIIGPESGAYLNTADVSVTWEAHDASSEIVMNRYFLDDVEVFGPLGTSFGLTGLSEGTHTFEVYAYDQANNQGHAVVSFMVDLTDPTLQVTAIVQGLITNAESCHFVWNAVDDGSGIAGFTYSFDGAAWSAMTSSQSLTLTGLADGAHAFRVKAIDNAGNSVIGSVSLLIDTTAPVLTITSPVDGKYFNATTVNDVTVTWSASDAVAGLAPYQVRVNGGSWTQQTSTSLTLTDLADGTYRIDVRAIDQAGNAIMRSVSFTVDRIVPTLNIISPTAKLYNITDIAAAWTGSDDLSGVSGYCYRLDSGSWSGLSSALDVTLTSLAQGEHTLYVQVRDVAGNVNTSSVTFTIDSVAPTISAFGPEGSNVDTNSNLTATFSEAMNRTSVVFTVGMVEGTLSWTGDQVTFTPAAALEHLGTYIVSISGKDVAGNPVSKAWTIVTDAYQGSLIGVLRDSDGVILANTLITLSNGQNTTTDANGSFEFPNLAPGHYNMTVSREGYNDLTVGATVGLDQVMDMGAVHVDVIPTTASNWWPFILAFVMTIVVAMFVVVLVKRRKK